jgi:hypothetical protein
MLEGADKILHDRCANESFRFNMLAANRPQLWVLALDDHCASESFRFNILAANRPQLWLLALDDHCASESFKFDMLADNRPPLWVLEYRSCISSLLKDVQCVQNEQICKPVQFTGPKKMIRIWIPGKDSTNFYPISPDCLWNPAGPYSMGAGCSVVGDNPAGT